jgi:hypothetical protein
MSSKINKSNENNSAHALSDSLAVLLVTIHMNNSMETNASRRKILVNTASLGFFMTAANSAAFADVTTLSKDESTAKVTNDDKNVAGDWLAQADETFFNTYADSSFEFWNAAGRARATLSNVRSFTAAGKSRASARAFSLDFVIQESTRNLPADLCYVTHAKLGTFELFVVPHSNAKGDRLLLATFARL